MVQTHMHRTHSCTVARNEFELTPVLLGTYGFAVLCLILEGGFASQPHLSTAFVCSGHAPLAIPSDPQSRMKELEGIRRISVSSISRMGGLGGLDCFTASGLISKCSK